MKSFFRIVLGLACALNAAAASLVLIPHSHGNDLEHRTHPECRVIEAAAHAPAGETPAENLIRLFLTVRKIAWTQPVHNTHERFRPLSSLRAPPGPLPGF